MTPDYEELIARWHSLAGQDKIAIACAFGDESLALLKAMLEQALNNSDDLPATMDADEFAEIVFDLRENERAWSRRLGDTIINADDLDRQGERNKAILSLEEFGRICPWRFFAEIAVVEQGRYAQS